MGELARAKAVLAWALWLVTFGCCAAGLVVTLAITRPLTLAVLAQGAVYAFFFVLGFATVGLVLALRRPANPIGWLYEAAGLAWAYAIPLGPWIDKLLREHRPCTASCWPWSTRPCSRPGVAVAAPLSGPRRVPAVGGIGYALLGRGPAPDLLPGAHAAGSRR